MSEQSILICRACTYPLGLRWPMRRGGTDGGCQNCGNDTHLGEFSAQDGHGIISRQAAHIAELEQANAALRAELAERTRQRDEVCKDPRLQLKWGVFVGGKIVIGCVLESRAAQLAALGRQDTPADSGEFSVRRVVAPWQEAAVREFTNTGGTK